MKYYYNGIKIRTSDNVYTHAVIRGEKVIACCGRKDLADKRARNEIVYQTKRYMDIENYFEQHSEQKTQKVIDWLKRQSELNMSIKVVELEIRN